MTPRPLPTTSRRVLLAVALASTALCAPPVHADTWPSKPIKVIVNFPAGGAADQLARAVSQPLQEALKQPVVIENRGGANGNVGGEAVARAAADGYTLLMSSGGMVSVNPHLYARMSFDPAKDLVPVAAAARVLVFLVTRPSLPPTDVKSFMAYLKANPGKLSYGSPGNGSSPHLAGEMFKSQAGLFALHVPYRGAAPALQDLLAGQIDYAFDPGIGLNQVRAGKLKLLAVGSPHRSSQFPDVPTLDEAGLRGFDADTVFGFYAPAGTPPEVVAQLNTQINRALALPAVKERIAAIGGEPLPGTPGDFQRRAAADSQRFGALIRERGIKAD
ncbi:tripartite tricarboxylate transporter substrate binding protein [Variovorax sp. YR752]|uniref:Bug family tripartite tricarboxylate transporter substrate binding protein n=1 Tax=Variovorax sp. YR752 TaxID=1884383 RepID=UPI0031378F2F